MAFRAMGFWKSMMAPMERSGRRSFASSTSQNLKQYSTASKATPVEQPRRRITMHDVPILLIFGFVGLAGAMAVHTAKQQLRHHPNVVITKEKRGSISEADDPNQASISGQKFVNKSFLRKVAHIQDK